MTFKPQNFVVWTEIPCTDMSRAMRFYSQVFHLELALDETGPNPMAVFPTKDKTGVTGSLYPGQPAQRGKGATVHFSVPDNLEATLERVKSAGGEVVSEIIAIPAGRFAYCLDPDGNSIGAFSA